jgi:hypothetical protein
VLVGGLIAALLFATAAVATVRRAHTGTGSVPAQLRAPDGVRIRVQVLNSTKVHGLARRATMLLRDRGFDVVETGTAAAQRDSTVVLDLSGHPDWAQRVARIMGGTRVEARPDSSRYLDIAVVLGASWRPPTQPFYP